MVVENVPDSPKGKPCKYKDIFCQELDCEGCFIFISINKCLIDDCFNKKYVKGLCLKHYTQLHRNNHVGLKLGTVEERFLNRFCILPEYRYKDSYCWVWNHSKLNNGYGIISLNGKRILAHRYSYEYFKNKLPKFVNKGLEIDHLCHNRLCVNPDHLELVEHKINVLRGNAKYNNYQKTKTHCPKGHVYDENNTWVNKLGHRFCRECHKIRESKRYVNKTLKEINNLLRGER